MHQHRKSHPLSLFHIICTNHDCINCQGDWQSQIVDTGKYMIYQGLHFVIENTVQPTLSTFWELRNMWTRKVRRPPFTEVGNVLQKYEKLTTKVTLRSHRIISNTVIFLHISKYRSLIKVWLQNKRVYLLIDIFH